MATKLLVAIFLSLLVSAVVGQQLRPGPARLSEAQQCHLQRLSVSRPSERIESEGGVTELWNEEEDQFQCAGVAPLRNTLRPNALSLPNFHPSPRLVYIERGQGLVGIIFSKCAETYHSGGPEEQGRRDLHQKVHRLRQGDIVAIPAGAAHWCYNDGNEELVAVSITDLNNQANQLDQKLRAFYLAGGPREGDQQARQSFQNILRAFDEGLMAEAYNIPVEIVRRMQREDERGLIVNVEGGLSVIRPDEEQQDQEETGSNGLEETWCTRKVRANIDNPSEADIYSRDAGRLHIVNKNKLPILRSMDLSAEKVNLLPNAMLAPHWSMNGHSIVYVTRGDAQMQVVKNDGQNVMNRMVSQGDMFVIPQYYAATAKAGRNGFEYVAVKTTSLPMKSPLVGYTSVLRAMPLQVLTNSYRASADEARDLKLRRGSQTLLLSPTMETSS